VEGVSQVGQCSLNRGNRLRDLTGNLSRRRDHTQACEDRVFHERGAEFKNGALLTQGGGKGQSSCGRSRIRESALFKELSKWREG